MSTEKTLKTRIRLKHDTQANWEKATNFRPLDGELIIYDPDDTHESPRFKVGKNNALLSELKFSSAIASDVYGWAKSATKPSYTASEVGAATKADITTEINKLDVTDAAEDGKYVSSVSETNGIIKVTKAALPTFTDTDTQYQLVLSGHTLKLQSKAKGGAWADVSGQSFTLPDNNTTYTFAEGTTNGAFSVTPSGSTAQSVKVHGLGTAAYKAESDFDEKGASAGVLGTSNDAATANTVYGAKAAAANAQSKADAATTNAATAQKTADDHIADKANPHGVTKSQVGLGNVDNVKQYSASNPPPYPVTSVAGKTGAVTLTASNVGLGNVQNKSLDTTVTASSGNYITSGAVKTYVDNAVGAVKQFQYEVITGDLPTASASTMGKIYLKAHAHGTSDSYDEWITIETGSSTKTYSWEKIGNTDIDLSGYVPTSRTVNGKALTGDISLGAADVGVNTTNFPGLNKTGTVTSVAVKMNDSVKGTITSSGTIDLGTVITAHQDISGKQDKITSSNKLSASLVSGLATVATTGSYNDLSDKPTIPTNTNQTVKVGTTTFGANAAVEIAAGSNVSVTAGTDKITISSSYTDTKVTSAANHYTPSADSSATLSVDASSTTAATWNSTSLVTGVNLQRDAKGHVTGVTVDSIKMPANPNTDTKYTAGTGITISSSNQISANIANATGTSTTSSISQKAATDELNKKQDKLIVSTSLPTQILPGYSYELQDEISSLSESIFDSSKFTKEDNIAQISFSSSGIIKLNPPSGFTVFAKNEKVASNIFIDGPKTIITVGYSNLFGPTIVIIGNSDLDAV